jgi:hypothetical protein
MKNITLAVEDEVLTEVRKYAALRGTTVNALVRDYLGGLARSEARGKKAREELLKLSEESTLDLGTWKWNREELYDRYELSRHKRDSLSGVAESTGRKEEDDRS